MAFERRWRGRKEDVGVAGKVEEVGDDGVVAGGEGKFSNVGVGGGDGGAGSAWVTRVNKRIKSIERGYTYLITVGKCEGVGWTAGGSETPRVHLAKKAVKRVFNVGTSLRS
jgi:hypothetical protein